MAKSNRLPEAAWPSTWTCFSGKCQPRGLTKSVAVLSASLYCFPSGLLNEMVPLTASRTLTCPSKVPSPGGRVGVFEIGHKTVCARVQGVDDHLAIRRPSAFHSAILEIRGHGLNLPGTGTNIFGF